MENNMDKWKAIWQTQKSETMQVNELITQLNAIEQRSKNQRLFLFLVIGILVVTSIIQLSEILHEKFYLIAYILTLLAIGVKLLPNLNSRYSNVTDEADLNNHNFVEKLNSKLSFETKHLVLFLFLAFLALNFALLGLYEKGTLFNYEFNSQNRLVIHLSTIAILFFGYLINIKKLKKSRNEISILKSQLEVRK